MKQASLEAEADENGFATESADDLCDAVLPNVVLTNDGHLLMQENQLYAFPEMGYADFVAAFGTAPSVVSEVDFDGRRFRLYTEAVPDASVDAFQMAGLRLDLIADAIEHHRVPPMSRDLIRVVLGYLCTHLGYGFSRTGEFCLDGWSRTPPACPRA